MKKRLTFCFEHTLRPDTRINAVDSIEEVPLALHSRSRRFGDLGDEHDHCRLRRFFLDYFLSQTEQAEVDSRAFFIELSAVFQVRRSGTKPQATAIHVLLIIPLVIAFYRDTNLIEST